VTHKRDPVIDNPASDLSVTLWGVHGSVPKPSLETSRFGCATSCYEITNDVQSLICDAGTGLVGLGQKLVQDNAKDIEIVFSHYHIDHVLGFPFFAPLYVPGMRVHVYASQEILGRSPGKMMKRLFAQPFFPMGLDAIKAELTCHDLSTRKTRLLCGATVECLPLCHPGGNAALRVQWNGKTIIYSGDFAHGDAATDAKLKSWFDNADLGLVECTFTPETYDKGHSFGHTHWEAAGALAGAARTWVGVHHHHLADDHDLATVDARLRALHANGQLGRDGQTIWL